MPRSSLAVVFALPLALAACEGESLHAVPEVPDAGFPDALPAPDAAEPDAGAPDAEAPPPPAREPIYIHTGDRLYSYDSDRNVAAEIGLFRAPGGRVIDDVSDIAIDLNGRMYGGTVSKEVWSINPLNAECRRLFAFDDRLHGLTFLSDGTLVVAGDRVSLVDPITGRVRRVLVGLDEYQTSGDIVGLPDGKLYWTVRGSGSSDGDLVIRIDPSSGRTDRLSTTGVQRIYGLGYAEDTLYGFSSDGLVVVIDSRSGSVLRERMLVERWWGATTNPVTWR